MRYWLMKSEPDAFSIDDLAKVGQEPWSGVRNYQARNFMWKDMRVGDGVFFYHSNAKVPGIVGIKEATGNIERAQWLIREAPKGFAIYSGDDPTAVALILLGGHGNISVTANVAPKAMSEICAAALAGDAKTAAAKQLALMPLHKALFIEANPIPVKWAAARMGLCQPGLRLPLTPLSDSCHATVEAAMKTCGLI